jgi:hypothetical protein
VGEEVAGADDQVGLERGQAAEPVLLGPLTGGQVQVGEVQHAQRLGAPGQQRERHLTQRVGTGLGGGVRDGREGGGGTETEQAGEEHVARLPQWPA